MMTSRIQWIRSFRRCQWLALFLVVFSLALFPQSATALVAQSSPRLTGAVAWSPDGRLIAYSSESTSRSDVVPSSIFLMNVATGSIERTLDVGLTSINDLDWSPDGTRLVAAVGSSDTFRVWNAASGQLLSVSQRGGQGSIMVRWRPNSDEIALGDGSGGVGIFSAITGEYLRTLAGGGIADWSPDGNQIVMVSSYDDDIYFSNAVSGQILRTIVLPYSHNDVDWSPDGRLLVTSDADEKVKIWDVVTSEQLATFNASQVVRVRWHPNSQRVALASFDGTLQILDVPSGQIVQTFTSSGRVYTVDWSPDGSQVAFGGVANAGSPGIVIASVVPATPGAQSNRTFTEAIAWSPDGTRIAYSAGPESCDPNQAFLVTLVNASNGTVIRTFDAGTCPVTGLDWSPDGTRIVGSLASDEGFKVWDVASGQVVATSELGGQGSISVRWRPNSNEIAVTAADNGARIFDATTGNFLRVPPVGGTRVSWNPDGSQLASVTFYGNDVLIVDAITGQTILAIPTDAENGDIDWSSDGSRLVTSGSDDIVRIWNAVTGQQLATFNIPNIVNVRWHPNSQRVALASFDGVLQILDVPSGQIVQTFTSSGRVYTVDWSPNGSQVAFGGVANAGSPGIVVAPVLPATPTPSLTPTSTYTPTPTLTPSSAFNPLLLRARLRQQLWQHELQTFCRRLASARSCH